MSTKYNTKRSPETRTFGANFVASICVLLGNYRAFLAFEPNRSRRHPYRTVHADKQKAAEAASCFPRGKKLDVDGAQSRWCRHFFFLLATFARWRPETRLDRHQQQCAEKRHTCVHHEAN